jgi:hypothetical protein
MLTLQPNPALIILLLPSDELLPAAIGTFSMLNR